MECGEDKGTVPDRQIIRAQPMGNGGETIR
jgi:hypothetical protein